MTIPNFQTQCEQLTLLANLYCDGRLDERSHAQLTDLLCGNRALQRHFLAQLDIHARLGWEASRGSGLIATRRASRNFTPPRWRSYAIAVVAALLLVGLSATFYGLLENSASKAPPKLLLPSAAPFVATILNERGTRRGLDATWRAGAPMLPGSVIDLPLGVLELECVGGTRLLLESPARLRLTGANSAFLEQGRLFTRVNPATGGFRVETNQAQLTDRGTEFGVEAVQNGATYVQVYEGFVDAKASDLGPASASQQILKGEACAIDGQVSAMEFQPNRFLRSFPIQDAGAKPLVLTNEPTASTLFAHRAVRLPTIDGDLSDWNRETAFVSRCSGSAGEKYYVEMMIRYDDERLYVAAHVGDPAPMLSRMDPAKELPYFWTGGSVVLRLAASNQFGWPLDAAPPSHRRRDDQLHPADMSEQLSHIGMWYSKLTDSPALVTQYSMSLDRRSQSVAASGWQGAFRKDADGRGYSFEYALDYALLRADRPQPGDVWPATVAVHWSDQEGRTCVGQLTDVVNPDQKRFTPFQGECWGKLQFAP